MALLNLTRDMKLDGEGSEIDWEGSFFPGGEPHIRIKQFWEEDTDITILTRINNFKDLGILMVAVNAINHIGKYGVLKVHIPYFPGARQDRVCNPGEALTVKVYTDLINSMRFDKVVIYDPHSDVTPALLNNCEVTNNHNFIRGVDTYLSLEDLVIVCPDAGAGKKIIELCKQCGFEDMVKCDKIRDLSTGKLSGFQVHADDLGGKPCLIVDDICDGGGTFMGLAEKLKEKNAGDLYLAVSHGIFSKGLDDLKLRFKKVFTTDSIRSVQADELVEVINLNEI